MAKYRHTDHIDNRGICDAVRWDGTPEMAKEIIRPHGYVMRLDGDHIVVLKPRGGTGFCFPGDWIVSDSSGVHLVITDELFLQHYEPVAI